MPEKRRPGGAERLIRELAVRIVEDKGYFALHADEDSYRLYDIQFWLYVNANPGVEDWLKNRKKAGVILKRDGGLWMSEEAGEDLRRKMG